MKIDLYILAFSAVTVLVTIWMGFRSAKKSKTASDFFVAGRSVGVGMNASAISGEYLSAASFMGIAGMVMSSGYDALWYPVCYACGYLFLLLFIAGPLRRFGAYTIPDFAEGRFDSPVFRKIAVVFVLFIGFFYTMPQMKGAGTTLAYIFPGLPYWAGVVLVGAVITLNVALGGMKGITLVQAFQYWAKMFAISVPIFVLMAVYGHYGKQVGVNQSPPPPPPRAQNIQAAAIALGFGAVENVELSLGSGKERYTRKELDRLRSEDPEKAQALLRLLVLKEANIRDLIANYNFFSQRRVKFDSQVGKIQTRFNFDPASVATSSEVLSAYDALLAKEQIFLVDIDDSQLVLFSRQNYERLTAEYRSLNSPQATPALTLSSERQPLPAKAPHDETWLNPFGPLTTKAAKNAAAAIAKKAEKEMSREAAKGAKENPHSDFATVASSRDLIPLRAGLSPEQHITVNLDSPTVAQALAVYAELTGRQLLPNTNSLSERADDLLGGKLSQLKLVARSPVPDSGVREHADGPFTAAEVKAAIEAQLHTNGFALAAVGANGFRVATIEAGSAGVSPASSLGAGSKKLAGGTPALPGAAAEKAWLAKHEKPLALLYTYSLIIAIVCGTAGLPHILVRFYTNPDGVAAKKTTMWVMILIGIFYVFPPVFGVIGRNLLPDLYNGVGAKGTDKIVLELPRLLNAKYPPLGSILSGITCAGAFAAFMSTFSGLLVSMTGALAHDVYGRILRPKATAEQRMRMFKIGAVIIGAVAILLGMQVEQLQINFMVGQAFAIAAASYFPLLFMAVWWRNLTMKGAATGMLTGGTLALAGISLTSFSDLKWINLADFWAWHPLLRILCEQPAIWAVPLAIALMVVVSKLTARTVPADIRMKMLVLHAPEQLGLKQEYIQEHHTGH